MNCPYPKTSTARAASLCCLFWHDPKGLNRIVTQANSFFTNTGIAYI